MPLVDVEVLDGSFSIERPAIILDAAMARKAVQSEELHDIIRDALGALELSGKSYVFVAEEEGRIQ